MRRIEDATFFFLIVAASLAFAWILWGMSRLMLKIQKRASRV
jgi:hypothetical protein